MQQALFEPSRFATVETLHETLPVCPGVDLAVTDLRTLCVPYVQPVREVLTGQRHRCKIRYGNALLVFHHGCLMGQIVYQGVIYALPPLDINADGTPYIRTLSTHRRHWLAELTALPKDLLLFYFTLLKEVFKGYALSAKFENPSNGRLVPALVPAELHPILREVDWRFS